MRSYLFLEPNKIQYAALFDFIKELLSIFLVQFFQWESEGSLDLRRISRAKERLLHINDRKGLKSSSFLVILGEINKFTGFFSKYRLNLNDLSLDLSLYSGNFNLHLSIKFSDAHVFAA
jgi:hypothetical protein